MISERSRSTWEVVVEGLGGVGKLRIIRVVLQKPNKAFTKYGLEKETKLKPVDVRTNLKTLTKLGWIKEYSIRPKTYKINLENEVVKYLSEFFRQIRCLQPSG